MSTYLAQRLTQMLIASGTVAEEDRELYVYGCFLLISRSLFLLATALMGLALGIPGASVGFYLLYTLLRGYAGGVHAKTETACTVYTTLAIAGSLGIIRLLAALHAQVLPMLMLGLGGLAVFLLSPLDTEEKPLEEAERIHYRRASLLVLAGCILLAAAAWGLELWNLLYAVASSVFLEGVLLTAGRLSP